MAKTKQLNTRSQCVALMRSYGMPMATVKAIMTVLVDDSVRNGQDVKSDRIYSLIAETLHDVLGFGVKRIMNFMHEFDTRIGQIADGEREWGEVMQSLEEKTGIVVRSGDDDRFAFEYMPKGESGEGKVN